MRVGWGTRQAAFVSGPTLNCMKPGDLAQRARPRVAREDISSTEVRLRLSSCPDAVSAARRGLDSLEPELGAQRLNDMRLLVSELVTNSVRHAGEGDELELEVSVRDELITSACPIAAPGSRSRRASRTTIPARAGDSSSSSSSPTAGAWS
jgi:hypothetical protein